MEHYSKPIGRNIKSIRESRGMTQEEVAGSINMAPSYYSSLERGVHRTTIDTLYKISFALGIDIRDLFVPHPSTVLKNRRGRLLESYSDQFDELEFEDQQFILVFLDRMFDWCNKKYVYLDKIKSKFEKIAIDQEIIFEVIEGRFGNEDVSFYISYGISAVKIGHGEKIQLCCLPDICTSKNAVTNLANAMQTNNVSTYHFIDIIQDFAANDYKLDYHFYNAAAPI